MAGSKKVPVLRLSGQGFSRTEAEVAEEAPLTIVLNGRELVTLLCSPGDPEYLAAGYVQSQGLINTRDDIVALAAGPGTVTMDTREEAAAPGRPVIASSGERGKGRHVPPEVPKGAGMRLAAARALSLMGDFEQRSRTFRDTGGVHSAALCDAGGIMVFNEDIGRHNAIDKVFGQCLLQGIPTGAGLLLITGRISSEILLKAAARSVPVIISRNAPTDAAVRLAGELAVTLIGFARGRSLTVYANDWRVTA